MNDLILIAVTLSSLLGLALYVWSAWSLSAVFAKAGLERWQAWVPVLNLIVVLRLGGFSGWFVLLALVPVLGQVALAVVLIIAAHRINLAFGLGVGMTVLAALLPPVWTSVLGWGSARWLGAPADQPPAGPLRTGNVSPAEAPDSLERALGFAPTMVDAPAPPPPAAPAPPPPVPPLPVPTLLPPTATPVPPAPSIPPAPGVPLAETSAPITQVPGAYTPPAAAAAAQPLTDPWSRPVPHPAIEFRLVPLSPETAPPETPALETPVAEMPVAEAPVAEAPVAEASTLDEIAADPGAPETQFDEPEHFDTSAEISAVVRAPAADEPRSARSAVAAQHPLTEIPDEDIFDVTVIGTRKRAAWSLVPPAGAPVLVTADVVIIGRRPTFDADYAGAQLVPVDDETRTVSKTHARLERQGESWVIVDLDSTNGVILLDDGGEEIDATPGVPERLTERFLLGDAQLGMFREGA